MKVLILTESAARSRYWEAALQQLKRSGIDVVLASVHASGELHKALEDRNIETVGFGASSSRDYPRVIYKLAGLVRDNKINVVHASEAISATLTGFACLFSSPTKCIFHYHHTQLTGTQKRLSRIGSKLSDIVMAVSEAARSATMRDDGTPADKTFVAYNGIESMRAVTDAELVELRQRLEIPENARIVAIVARLHEAKGHRTLLEACSVAADRMAQPLHLIVVGDGPEMEALKSQSRVLSGFVSHFVGYQLDTALWFSVADVVAMPSYFESFGLAAVEAMDCGKVLIASDVEGPERSLRMDEAVYSCPLVTLELSPMPCSGRSAILIYKPKWEKTRENALGKCLQRKKWSIGGSSVTKPSWRNRSS